MEIAKTRFTESKDFPTLAGRCGERGTEQAEATPGAHLGAGPRGPGEANLRVLRGRQERIRSAAPIKLQPSFPAQRVCTLQHRPTVGGALV